MNSNQFVQEIPPHIEDMITCIKLAMKLKQHTLANQIIKKMEHEMDLHLRPTHNYQTNKGEEFVVKKH
jgi:hypothetical protein